MLSVGVDIGSSTSHLVFSRIVLERLDSRYVVTTRETFYQSDILLTPYSAEETIDADALGAFIERQYKDAKVDPDEIDTGALILTGVAVRRRNARAIGELFARQAGKMVAVTAGDSLETVMAAYGSGAVARSIRDKVDGDECRRRRRHLEDRGLRRRQGGRPHRARRRRAARLPRRGRDASCASRKPAAASPPSSASTLELGAQLAAESRARARGAHGGSAVRGDARRLADGRRRGAAAARSARGACRRSTRSRFSGGVSEYIYGREAQTFGDLGALLAQEIRARVEGWGPQLERSNEGIRATVIGASQYTTQVSGSTIFVSPLDALPLRNVPVIAPAFALDGDDDRLRRGRRGDQGGAQAARSRRGRHAGRGVRALARLGDVPAARCVLPGRGRRPRGGAGATAIRWCSRATATSAACIGIHLREEMKLDNAIVSIDGLELKDFDYIDIGAMLPTLRRRAGGDQVADLSDHRRARQGLAAGAARAGGLSCSSFTSLSFRLRFPHRLPSASRSYLILALSPLRRARKPTRGKRFRMRALGRRRRGVPRQLPPSTRSCRARRPCTSATFSPR